MATYTMPAQTLPLNTSYDVIVVGGGPAGCTAAAASARQGAKTLLIEATSALGGMGTLGLVPAWCPFSDKERIIYGGMAEKIFQASKASTPHVPAEQKDWVPINPEALKRIYDDLVTSHGADVLFHTSLTHVDADKTGQVNTIVCSSKAGLTAFSAKVFIDATGDADLATWAGAPVQKGKDNNGKLMPVTHCFILSNVDEYAYKTGHWLHAHNPQSPMFTIVNSGQYPHILDTHCCNNTIGPSTVGFNAGHIWDVDNTDPLSLSKGLIEGRKVAADFRQALSDHHPAFKNAFLVATGSLLGIRETRRIVGDYVLTVEDYMNRRSFEDEICRNAYYIDIHGAKEEVQKNKDHASTWKRIEERTFRYAKGESHGVPYRCLLPKNLNNVLVAGRAVSCDHIVQGSVRVMPVCLAMGEAAGMAGAMAAQSADHNVHKVDVQAVRTKLRELGAYLP